MRFEAEKLVHTLFYGQPHVLFRTSLCLICSENMSACKTQPFYPKATVIYFHAVSHSDTKNGMSNTAIFLK